MNIETLISTSILIGTIYFWIKYSRRVDELRKKQQQEELKEVNLTKYRKDLDKIFDYDKVKYVDSTDTNLLNPDNQESHN